MSNHRIIVTVALICLLPASVFAQQAPVIYPAKGQSQGQMDKDKGSCYGWAKQQTGFDPMQAGSTAQTAPATQPIGGERVKGAAKGAAAGAIVGGIGGDAGKGAAVGAAVGTMAGGAKQRAKIKQTNDAQQQQQAQLAQQQSNYNRAFGACMEGRGYTVK
jgi:hypothetical protein